MHTVKVTLGTNKLEPRGQCETAGGAVVSLNELFEFSCLTRPSIDIPFVFCSVSQRMVRPPERIITGCSAAHEGKPYSQNCCCLKAVTHYMHLDYYILIIAAFSHFYPNDRVDQISPNLCITLSLTRGRVGFTDAVFIQEHCNHF